MIAVMWLGRGYRLSIWHVVVWRWLLGSALFCFYVGRNRCCDPILPLSWGGVLWFDTKKNPSFGGGALPRAWFTGLGKSLFGTFFTLDSIVLCQKKGTFGNIYWVVALPWAVLPFVSWASAGNYESYDPQLYDIFGYVFSHCGRPWARISFVDFFVMKPILW